MNKNEYPVTNIFAKALLDRYDQLGVGAPDARIMEAVERAADIVTAEVKELLNEQFELRQSRKRKLLQKTD